MARSLDLLPLVEPDVQLALDLGSGGGLPGLPLFLALPSVRWHLLDGSATRCQFLREAVIDLASRLSVATPQAVTPEVIEGRAEEAGRSERLRGRFDLVVARSFGPPAVTAECAAPFLRVGGQLIVAEPPENPPRWPADGLRQLGLVVGPRVSEPSAFQVLRQAETCPERYPRRVGIPAKRPLF